MLDNEKMAERLMNDFSFQSRDFETHREDIIEALRETEARIREEYETLLNIPGTYQCIICHFVLNKRVLSAKTGDIHISKTPIDEPCPNDGQPMVPISWKQEALELRKGFLEHSKSLQARVWGEAAEFLVKMRARGQTQRQDGQDVANTAEYEFRKKAKG